MSSFSYLTIFALTNIPFYIYAYLCKLFLSNKVFLYLTLQLSKPILDILKMAKKLRWLIICIFVPSVIYGQELNLLEPLSLVDMPTAGTLMRGSFSTQLKAYPQGGILAEIDVGISDRFMFGISYGGTNIIGVGSINWNPQIGTNVRYRLFEEDWTVPAILIGFDSQGNGAYVDSTKRYLEKSRGLFAVASKNFNFLGTLGLHGGVNYSFERKDGDKDLNIFVGLDKTINPELALVAEYDFAINDDNRHSFGSGNGYLNAGIKWTFAGRLELNFIVKNLLKNRDYSPQISREIKITYVEIF